MTTTATSQEFGAMYGPGPAATGRRPRSGSSRRTLWEAGRTAMPGGAGAAQDVGVFMTAANGWTGRRGTATFELTLDQ